MRVAVGSPRCSYMLRLSIPIRLYRRPCETRMMCARSFPYKSENIINEKVKIRVLWTGSERVYFGSQFLISYFLIFGHAEQGPEVKQLRLT
jgi:hypothetical protein